MTRRVLENSLSRKVCVDFLVHNGRILILRGFGGCSRARTTQKHRGFCGMSVLFYRCQLQIPLIFGMVALPNLPTGTQFVSYRCRISCDSMPANSVKGP